MPVLTVLLLLIAATNRKIRIRLRRRLHVFLRRLDEGRIKDSVECDNDNDDDDAIELNHIIVNCAT
jgi:hypothetical protein